MILAAFSLKKLPFQKGIPEKDLYYNEMFEQMKSRLEFLFENQGIGLFTGEVGAGKSTMLRSCVSSLSPQLYKIVYIHRGIDTLGNFYIQIAKEMGIIPKFRASEVASQVINTINELSNGQNIKTVLIIDEAHLLKPEILDEIRLLHNAEMDSRDNLATAIVGQPPLKKMMTYMKFLPLAQRISVSFHLSGLNRGDAYKYFEHQLKCSGAKSNVFKDNAIETIINAAKGIPRVLNNIGIKSMYAAVQKKMTVVDQECVMDALSEIGIKV